MIPLQITSSYTLLDSTITLDRLIEKADEKNIRSLGLTDRNVLYGAFEFYKKCRKRKIKPLIGLTLDVGGNTLLEKEFPILLYARNLKGYQQLMQLSTRKMTLSGKEILSFDFLKENLEDLIVILPLLNSEPVCLQPDNEKKALLSLKMWQEIVPEGNLYLGTSLGLIGKKETETLLKTEEVKGLPWVAVDEIRIMDQNEQLSLRVLQAIRIGTQLKEVEKVEHSVAFHSFFEQEETYRRHFGSESIENTRRIAKACNLEIPVHQSLLPRFPLPEGYSAEEALRLKCKKGLKERLPEAGEDYIDRLDHELAVIEKMGFSDYFLIVWDLIRYARERHILTGAGRGSAAGSLVAYVLYITDVDPLRYGLLFERFLNEARKNMPDIDLDFPDDRREEMLLYTKNKYGQSHAAQIATFGTLAAKAAIRDTGRVMGLSQSELSRWSQAIPSEPGITLEQAYHRSKSLQTLISEGEQQKNLFHTAKTIEGLPRHVGTHAAGVVISDRSLENIVPLQSGNGVLHLTQYTMGAVEEIGLLKMDFLGLKNLTILANAVHDIKKSVEPSFSLGTIPEDDSKTLKLFRAGDTAGIFQFESPGIKNALRTVKPYSLEDVASVNALYRPGPMEQIKPFADRKSGRQSIEYPHEDLKEILENTYGIMIYQEQVMLVASKLAGYSLGEADILRRAISKKERNVLEKERIHFLEGAQKKGYANETARTVYDYIERFADYGFNRSHAVAYSLIAYQMAYIKTHYPGAFYAAILNASYGNREKIQTYIREARKNGVLFSPLDINLSTRGFAWEDEKIRLGFLGVKGLRRDFIAQILSLRSTGSFQDFIQFIRRIDSRWRKEEWIKPLILTGAFDSLGTNRATLLASLESILSSVAFSGNNMELFDVLSPKYEKKEEMSLEEKLDAEFQYTDLYISGHPTEFFPHLRLQHQTTFLSDFKERQTGTVIVLIKEIKRIKTKNGEPMAFAECQDVSGNGSLVIFPETYRSFGSLLAKGNLLLVKGKMEERLPAPKMIVNEMTQVSREMEQQAKDIKRCFLKIPSHQNAEKALGEIEEVIQSNRGPVEVILYVEKSDKRIQLKTGMLIKKEVLEKLREILGNDNVVVQ